MRWLGASDLSQGGSVAGVQIVEGPIVANEKAPAQGVYELNGNRFRIREGDAIPEGGTFVTGDKKPAGKRARSKASENRAKPDAGENREKAD